MMTRYLTVLLGLSMFAAPVRAAEVENFTVLGHTIAKFAAARIKIDAIQAIDVARKSAGDVVFTMVELVMDGPRPIYEVLYVSDQGPSEVEVDAISGEIIPLPPEPATPETIAQALKKKAALAAAGIDLRRAIEAAAQETHTGVVVKAVAEIVDKAVQFDVEFLIADAFKTARLDASGAVKQIADSTDEPGGRAWTFDDEPAGTPPSGWQFSFTHPDGGKARWTVETDPKPMTGPNALKLVTESGSRTFNLAIARDTAYDDVEVRTRLRPVSGNIDQGGGLIWRCKDADNYYICRFNPLESNFRVYKVSDGKRSRLQSVNIATEPGNWYAVHAKMIGDHIMCFLNGSKLLDVRDDTFKDAGMIGLWTKADASSCFDNIAVRNAIAKPSDADPVANPTAVSSQEDDDDDGD